jgi:diadenosine tetraphosphate (Ap4A) HIT family hydrolase
MKEKDCPHCDENGFALKHILMQDTLFWVVCDVHPLEEGHILIIPKNHISCMGALPEESFRRYKELYDKVLKFVNKAYGKAGVFEHGITGQTVFHAHTHFMPFGKNLSDVVPETAVREISSLDNIKKEFEVRGKYLFTAINNDKFLVDTKLGYPRFFRERFAKVLGAEERANWKEARNNKKLMKTFEKDILALEKKWENS